MTQPPLDFGGSTYVAKRDGQRLAAQLHRVMNQMQDGRWMTLGYLADLCGDPEASISARLRDLRKLGFTVERRYVSKGLFEYRVRSKE